MIFNVKSFVFVTEFFWILEKNNHSRLTPEVNLKKIIKKNILEEIRVAEKNGDQILNLDHTVEELEPRKEKENIDGMKNE